MNKIIEYTNVDAKNPAILEEKVKRYMEIDYQPFGSVYKWNGWLVQTVVKYDK